MTNTICVIGLGYIGLPTAALLANRDFKVYGVDVNSEVVDTINRGEIHIVEPELDAYVAKAVSSGNLRAGLRAVEAEVFIIAVPTPFHDGYIPNVDFIVEATESLAGVLKEGDIVILESTSPIGTTELVRDTLQNCGVDTSLLHIAHCPERVLPGHIMRELVENDRIVGAIGHGSAEKVAQFYRTFVSGEVLITDSRTAELSKLVENSYRDVNIAFANEISILCDKFEIDVWELIKLANRHPRVNVLQPGPGVGGHCIAVDPWFIVHASGGDARLIKQAREVNNSKPDWVVDKISEKAKDFERDYNRSPTIACMGLTFKPNIDDLRESPALGIFHKLNSLGFDVLAVEPNLKSHRSILLTAVDVAMQDADLFVFLVAHSQFKSIDLPENFLDFCGVLSS
ncbi:UDP-N-acetyl-D-mannosamine dehydrogenase [Pseudidiomarina gelatinasegens]|uniref:UDP-N-acetyl-D-mannosamine dehydrogenase n=1 Tax=Pseudidiomarina gelatinasegens TaxID=2487740 RepID=UPI0030EC2817